MKRTIVKTADGSTTLRMEGWDEPYHSMHGAIAEARHVFIKQGLHGVKETEIELLEMGFGTGLNALITLIEARRRKLLVHYTGLEAYPVTEAEWTQLNYIDALHASDFSRQFLQMHQLGWEKRHTLSPGFTFEKKQCDFLKFTASRQFHLIYFDAFGARVQPELWTPQVFVRMFEALREGGILVTYAAKGSVRRALQQTGFKVERLPGPPGKREMLRATREGS